MHTKFLMAALGSALIAAGESMMSSADACPDDIEGALIGSGEEDTASATTVTDTTRDAEGLPWHPGIHAGTKKFKGDGTWTRKKGVADTYYAEVVAELRKTNPVPAATLALPAATPGLALPGVTGGLQLPTPVVVTHYQKLIDWIAKNVDKGSALTMDWVNAAFASHNVVPATLATNEAGAEEWLALFRKAQAGAGIAEVV